MNTVAGEAEMTCQHECSPFIAFPHGLQRHTYGICHCKLPRKEGRNKGLSSRGLFGCLLPLELGGPVTADTLTQSNESVTYGCTVLKLL